MDPAQDIPDGQDGGQPGPNGQQGNVQPTETQEQGGNSRDPGYDERLKNIEDILIEMRREKERKASGAKERNTRSRSTSCAARSTRSTRSPAHSSASRHRCGGHRSPCSRRRDRSRTSSRTRHHSSKSRSATPRSRGSRSRSRSGRRKSSRLRSSRSKSTHRYDRKTRSRSKDAARRSSPARSSKPSTRDGRDVARALSLQYPQMGKSRGKPLPTSRATLEPYRNLPPELKSRAAERKSRRDLLFPEHMCGLLSMICETLDPTTEAYAAIRHTAHVAEDATTLHWREVRGWSQACLTHLQDGGATWLDYELFDRDRTKLSWVKGKAIPDTKVPCHAHNMELCAEKSAHHAEGYAFLHVCAICFYGLEREDTNHIAKRCNKKAAIRAAQDEARHDFKRRNNLYHNKKEAPKSDAVARPKN